MYSSFHATRKTGQKTSKMGNLFRPRSLRSHGRRKVQRRSLGESRLSAVRVDHGERVVQIDGWALPGHGGACLAAYGNRIIGARDSVVDQVRGGAFRRSRRQSVMHHLARGRSLFGSFNWDQLFSSPSPTFIFSLRFFGVPCDLRAFASFWFFAVDF